jgi:hypothetical protein
LVPGQGWPDLDALVRFGGTTGFSGWNELVPLITTYHPLGVGDAIGVGDFDGDGFGDMVMTERYGTTLLRGCAPAASPWGWLGCGNCQLQQIATGDFDGDGRSDVVFADGTAIGIFPGTTAALTMNKVAGMSGLTVVDFNDDGYSDLVVLDWGGGAMIGYQGGPAGLSTTPSAAPQPPPFQLAGDFNGDDYWDVITLGCVAEGCFDDSGPTLVGYGGPGGWGAPFTATAQLNHAIRDVTLDGTATVVDLDADGYDDLLVAGTGSIAYYAGSPAGLATTPTQTISP